MSRPSSRASFDGSAIPLRGIADLIPFLNFLDQDPIFYRLDHLRDDSVMVSFTLVGLRVELDFFDDHVEFSAFRGTEEVEDDPALLFGLIREYGTDD